MMIWLTTLVVILSLLLISIFFSGYIRYSEYAPIEDIRIFLKDGYISLSLFELLLGLSGLISVKNQLVIQFLNWWIFCQGSKKYPYIFKINSFFPIKMAFMTLIKAVIIIKSSFKIPYVCLVFPYLLITICVLPLLFAFSYPFEDSKLENVVWDSSSEEDIILTTIKIITDNKSRNEYKLYITNKFKRVTSNLYRRNNIIRKLVSSLPENTKSFIISKVSVQEI
ncbi:hypothetical protein FG386_002605 [Cryptosporidium ryanae]|uniref:uncharacterized protein n=1 Tax=Cryptosporidium ryanae TaxID=515981 RepID=UPI00351A2A4D|nr:hypothetical protein FG386_002605 [Cryptosporidium ryanae]